MAAQHPSARWKGSRCFCKGLGRTNKKREACGVTSRISEQDATMSVHNGKFYEGAMANDLDNDCRTHDYT
jgi:hypothetical protein